MRYRNLSVELVRQRQPHWSMAKLVAQAKREWESSALEWMVAVLRRLRALRPRARFGIHSAEIVESLLLSTDYQMLTFAKIS